MAIGPIHVHADDLLEVIGGFANVDISAKKIGVSVSSFGLLQQPSDVCVCDFECVSDWTVGIPAYADQYSRLVLKEAVGASPLLVAAVCVYEAGNCDHGFSPNENAQEFLRGREWVAVLIGAGLVLRGGVFVPTSY
jgi:hypothetical protein